MFFDLSIPYLETLNNDSSKNKTLNLHRLKTLARAMELGYTAAAYDRPFKGVMSDAERCRIPRFSLPDLINVAPALPSSAAFHRRRSGVPASLPFRQYTRVTISVDKLSVATAFKCKGVLRSYDLVAAKPLDQDAFDKACLVSDIDIIALDLPLKFRLNLSKAEPAIKRGVYFEIKYSTLIADVQVRRQMLSDAKLLVDWTHGKNLIISSSAISVNDIRGPYDVVNLSSFLLGLSKERAKAAISRNCRTLIANALRKKDYKEAIRIEKISSNEQLDSGSVWFGDWKAWDPIDSGEGDFPPLDEISKLFSSFSKPPKPPPAVDFLSCPKSFSLKDHISGIGKVSTSLTKTILVEERKTEVSMPRGHIISSSEGSSFPPNDTPRLFVGSEVEPIVLVADNKIQQSPIKTNEAFGTFGVQSSYSTSKHCTSTGNENRVSLGVNLKCESTDNEMSTVCIEDVYTSHEGGVVSVPIKNPRLPADLAGNNSGGVATSHLACRVTETFFTRSSEKDILGERIEEKAVERVQKGEVSSLKHCTFSEKDNLAPCELNLKHDSTVDEISTMCIEDIDTSCEGGLVSLATETPKHGMDLVGINSSAAASHLSSNVSESVCARSSEKDFVLEQIKGKAVEREQKDEVLSDCVPEQMVPVESAPSEDREDGVSLCNDVPFEDAFSELTGVTGQEQDVLINNDAPTSKVLVKTVDQNNHGSPTAHSRKSGKRRRKGRSNPAYLLPIKGFLKPQLFKKKLYQSRKPR